MYILALRAGSEPSLRSAPSSAKRTFPTLVFGHVADAAFVRCHSAVLFAVQWVSPEQPYKSAFRHQSQTVFSLRRERAMIRFRRMRTLQKFVAVHASIHNHFNQDRSLSQRDHFKANRTAALNEWRGICAT